MHTKSHLIVNNLMFETDCAFHSKDSLHIDRSVIRDMGHICNDNDTTF